MADPKFTTNAPNLTGQRFHRLLVQGYAYSKNKVRHWHCLCDCGQEPIVTTKRLTTGHTKSCGCLNREIIEQRRVTAEAKRERRNKNARKRLADNPSKIRAERKTQKDAWRAEKDALGLCILCGKRPQRETSSICQECHSSSIANRKKRVRECAARRDMYLLHEVSSRGREKTVCSMSHHKTGHA